jgi:hypothetical protein
MVNESTIVVIVCVSFVNVIPKLSGRMDFGYKCYPSGLCVRQQRNLLGNKRGVGRSQMISHRFARHADLRADPWPGYGRDANVRRIRAEESESTSNAGHGSERRLRRRL